MILLTVFYGSLITGELLHVRKDASSQGTSRPHLNWLKLVLLLHFGVILARGFEINACPVGSRWEALSLLAFLIALLQWLLVIISKDRSTLLYGLALAFILQLGSTTFSLTFAGVSPPVLDGIRSLHAFSALFGLAGVAIAGVHGILWELLRRSIKKGKFGSLFNQLSSLESLSRLLKLATVISAVTLTVTVASAFLLVDDSNRDRSLGYESMATILTWLIFSILAIFPRATHSVTVWRTWFSIAGFAVVLFVIVYGSMNGFHAA